MTIGDRLRALREAAGMTLDEVSRATGIAASNLSLIENGKTDPRWSTVMRVLDALGGVINDLEPRGMGGVTRPASARASGFDPWERLRRKADRGEDVAEEARVLAINARRRAVS